MIKYLLLFLLWPCIVFSVPSIYFTDLTSGPNTGGENNNGVYVTIYGKGFGSTQSTSTVTVGGGLVSLYPVWSDTKITVQLGSSAATGNIVVTVGGESSNGIAFTVRSGSIYFCSPTGTGDGSYASPFDPSDYCTILAAGEDGATCYFRGGAYYDEYTSTGWRSNFVLRTTHSGASGNENAFIAYPGETTTLSRTGVDAAPSFNFRRYDGDEGGAYIVISGFNMISDGACVYVCSNSRTIGNTMLGGTAGIAAGIIGIGGESDGSWAVHDALIYGNTISGGLGPGTQDHAIYPGYGCDNIDIGWNTIASSDALGSKISVNNNTAYALNMVFENILIHHNFIDTSSSTVDGRAINVFESAPGSTIYIYDNIIIADTSSGSAAPLSFCSGGITIWGNSVYATSASTNALISMYVLDIYGHVYNLDSMSIKNNVFYGYSPASYYLEITGGDMPSPSIDHNLWYGIGTYSGNVSCDVSCSETNGLNSDPLFTTSPPTSAADFILQSGSPAIGAGSALSVVSSLFTTDFYGVALSDPVDLGAITYTIGATSITCYPDIDSDGYPGSGSEIVETCSTSYYESSHFTDMATDCNDTNAFISPGATEILCDGIDQDCNGSDDCSTTASGSTIGTLIINTLWQ
jgi:hypothetical protein